MTDTKEAYADFIGIQVDDLRDVIALLNTLSRVVDDDDNNPGMARVLAIACRRLDQVIGELANSENRY